MKTIVLTGANGGIGFPLTKRLLELGNRVIAIDIVTDRLDELIKKQSEHLQVYNCDVRDEEALRNCIQEAYQKYQSIDIAVHSACNVIYKEFEKSDNDTFKTAFLVDFYGALYLTRSVIEIMKKQKVGQIYFSSSSCGVMGTPFQAAYGASKGAIESLAKCLDVEYSDWGISFHIIQPPITNTAASAGLDVPQHYKMDPQTVGYGLAERLINNKAYMMCYSAIDQFKMKYVYMKNIKQGHKIGKIIKKYRNKYKNNHPSHQEKI